MAERTRATGHRSATGTPARAAVRRAASAAAVAGGAPRASKKAEPKLTEIPLGIAQVLPTKEIEGELVPIVTLHFDPATQDVAQALSEPKSLLVNWPITGKVNNLHDLTLPCVLSWRVNPLAGVDAVEMDWRKNPDTYLSQVDGAKTELKIDGQGHFQVLVDGKAPILDFISARLVGRGLVGYSLSLPRPSGTAVQESEAELAFELLGDIQVELLLSKTPPAAPKPAVSAAPAAPAASSALAPMSVAPADATATYNPTAAVPPDDPAAAPEAGPRSPCLGDRMRFTSHLHKLLQQTELELRVVEKESGIFAEHPDVMAWHRLYGKGKAPPFEWQIGFTDGSSGSLAEPKFSYEDDEEEGGTFEYGWELHAKSTNPKAARFMPIRASKSVILVNKPYLDSFHVEIVDAQAGKYLVKGSIVGFSPDAPPIRLAIWLIDRLGVRYPENSVHIPKPVLGRDGSFEQTIFGPRAEAPAGTALELPKVFAILSLMAAWKTDALVESPEGSVGGFLGFDNERFAYYHLQKGTTTESKTLWVCSEEWIGITPRLGKKSKDQVAITAPGPSAGGGQYSLLVFDDVWNDILAWEGFVRHMYLDSKGLVTVGAGCYLPTAEDALAMKAHFLNRQTKTVPDDALIRKTYATVAKMPGGQNWANYETSPLLELDPDYVKELAESYMVHKAVPAMHNSFGAEKFDGFPKCARRAILDIAYNAGTAFLDTKSPQLKAAIVAKNWIEAAAQVPKPGRPERRAWRQELFEYAHFIDTGEKV